MEENRYKMLFELLDDRQIATFKCAICPASSFCDTCVEVRYCRDILLSWASKSGPDYEAYKISHENSDTHNCDHG